MLRFTLTLNILWICFFQCCIICDDSIYNIRQNYGAFNNVHKYNKPTGKALEDICDCDSIEIITTKDTVLRKHGQLIGNYRRRYGKDSMLNKRPTYEHYSGNFFLYYNNRSQGFWAIGERLGSEVVRIENQGDRICPYYLKSMWRYADGDLNSLVYDTTLKISCLNDPCSIAHCGHQAVCLPPLPKADDSTKKLINTLEQLNLKLKGIQNITDIAVSNEDDKKKDDAKESAKATCVCKRGFKGNPFERCYPQKVPNGCGCGRLVFSTRNPSAVRKHENSYGEYFLFDINKEDGSPIYQHFAGIEYMYKRDGHWLVSDKIGLHEAGLQNQGEELTRDGGGKDPNFLCPYRFRTAWEYADVERLGWQWVYDHSANLICPQDPCSVVKCGFHASCTVVGDQGICACDVGYNQGNPYQRCYPHTPATCNCKELQLTSTGPSALAQSDKMGKYHLFGYYNRKPAYQHESGLDYLFYAEGEAWVIGAMFGGARVGIVNFDKHPCPYELKSLWRHSVGGKLEKDPGITMVCLDDELASSLIIQPEPSNSINPDVERHQLQNIGNVQNNEYQQNLDLLSAPSIRKPGIQNKVDNIETYEPYTTPLPPQSTLTGYFPLGSPYETTTRSPKPSFFPSDTYKPNPETTTKRIVSVTSAFLATTKTVPKFALYNAVPSAQSVTAVSDEYTTESTTFKLNVLSTEATKDSVTISVKDIEKKETSNGIKIPRPTGIQDLTIKRKDEIKDNIDRIDNSITVITPGEERTNATSKSPFLETTVCDCPKVVISSEKQDTIKKHGNQLGSYHLRRVLNGRPVYEHDTEKQFLYYHPYSGGNWLINSAVGLLYGGIQNSKDVPICPYLINTMWQYGDSELGGWVYDPTLRVTCPTDPCSVLKCGFRAQCVYDSTEKAHCVCRPGYIGDPKERCYPADIKKDDNNGDGHCTCLNLKLISNGPSKRHQADKMGEFHLWGYYNSKPVYQHESGLDFLYYHRNNVWGVGPKIGGNSAGLLNFGRELCPYDLVTPWEFGTRRKSKQRQVDYKLEVTCQKDIASSSLFQNKTLSSELKSIFPSSLPPTFLRPTTSAPDPRFNQSAPTRAAPIILPKCGGVRRSAALDNIFGSHPWQAEIIVLQKQGKSSKMHLCSAVILSKKHILTSASCLTEYPMKKYRILVAGKDKDTPEQEFTLQSIFTHDGYNEETGENNIAIVKLKKRLGIPGKSSNRKKENRFIHFGDFVQPICLPSSDKIKTIFSQKKGCKFSGWNGGKSGEHYLVGHAAEINKAYSCGSWQDGTSKKHNCLSVRSSSPPKHPIENNSNRRKGKNIENNKKHENGMPLVCLSSKSQSSFHEKHKSSIAKNAQVDQYELIGLYTSSKILDSIAHIDPRNGSNIKDKNHLQFLNISPYLSWINIRLTL